VSRGKGQVSATIAVGRRLCSVVYTLAIREVPIDPSRHA
jgi:hypothetical protein